MNRERKGTLCLKIVQQLQKKTKHHLELNYLVMPFTTACAEGNLSRSSLWNAFTAILPVLNHPSSGPQPAQRHPKSKAFTCALSWSVTPTGQPCTPCRFAGFFLCENPRLARG